MIYSETHPGPNGAVALNPAFFPDIGHRDAQPLPRARRHLPRVLRLGPANHAGHRRPEHDLPLAHLPDERPDHGHQGHPVVPQRAVGRRPIRRLRPEAVPPRHGVLHLPADPADDHQHVLVLRDDQHLGGVRGHLQRGVRLRGRCYRREG